MKKSEEANIYIHHEEGSAAAPNVDALRTPTKKNLTGIAVSNAAFVNEKEIMALSTTIQSPTRWNYMDLDAKAIHL